MQILTVDVSPSRPDTSQAKNKPGKGPPRDMKIDVPSSPVRIGYAGRETIEKNGESCRSSTEFEKIGLKERPDVFSGSASVAAHLGLVQEHDRVDQPERASGRFSWRRTNRTLARSG